MPTMKDRPVLPPLPPSKLASLDDLLTDEQKQVLQEDLRRIAETIRPCWRHDLP